MSIAVLCRPRVQDRVEQLLARDRIDLSAIAALADRTTYADAASHLLIELTGERSSLLITTILELSGSATAFRLACVFGILPRTVQHNTLYTFDSLRASEHPRARLALIAAGDPIDWPTATRDERAVFVLRAIVRTMAACHD